MFIVVRQLHQQVLYLLQRFVHVWFDPHRLRHRRNQTLRGSVWRRPVRQGARKEPPFFSRWRSIGLFEELLHCRLYCVFCHNYTEITALRCLKTNQTSDQNFITPPDVLQVSERQKFFSIFYMSINAGSLLSTVITPILRGERSPVFLLPHQLAVGRTDAGFAPAGDVQCFGGDCYALAFGVPAALMIVALGERPSACNIGHSFAVSV